MMTAVPTEQRAERPTLTQRFHRMDEVKFGLLLLPPTA